MGDVCDFSELACGCKTIEASSARRLNQFGKLRICGKNNGDQFLNAVRPDLDGTCPSGYKPCSKKTGPEATICHKESKPQNETCPITDIKFIDKNTTASETK